MTAHQPIRVFLLEDHASTRTAFRLALQSTAEFQWVGEAACLADARMLAPGLEVDVWLVDLNLPDGSGIEFIRECIASDAGARIMVVSIFGDDEKIFSAIEAGATGYILKEMDEAGISKAVRELYLGGAPMSAAIARRVLTRLQTRSRIRPDVEVLETVRASGMQVKVADEEMLTEREAEVLQHLAQGYRDKEIAGRLGVSTWTINTHVRHIYQKLQVKNRTSALRSARALGLINPE